MDGNKIRLFDCFFVLAETRDDNKIKLSKLEITLHEVRVDDPKDRRSPWSYCCSQESSFFGKSQVSNSIPFCYHNHEPLEIN